MRGGVTVLELQSLTATVFGIPDTFTTKSLSDIVTKAAYNDTFFKKSYIFPVFHTIYTLVTRVSQFTVSYSDAFANPQGCH